MELTFEFSDELPPLAAICSVCLSVMVLSCEHNPPQLTQALECVGHICTEWEYSWFDFDDLRSEDKNIAFKRNNSLI